MANNPQRPNGNSDPSGSTQMFQAFVNEGGQPQPTAATTPSSGPRVGMIVGVIVVVVVVIAAVAWLALS
jgi:hypothetical protein